MTGYDWDFATVWQYRALLATAGLVTLQLIVLTMLVGISVGFLLALVRLAKRRIFSISAMWLVEFLRAVPPLVLLIWVYYCIPILLDVRLSGFQTGVLALGIYSAAFYAEIFRAGIQSIEKGQIEAGMAVGMTSGQIMRRIVVPVAFMRIFPPFISQGALVIKNTVLVSAIAVGELLYEGQRLSIHTFRPLEILTVIALIFIAIIMPLTLSANALESRIRSRYS